MQIMKETIKQKEAEIHDLRQELINQARMHEL